MTDRKQQQVSIIAQFTLAVSVVALTITVAVGIARVGAIYGTVSSEHQQIFRQLRECIELKK